jgi:DNA-binding HxlR family transcriptional regulator
VTGMQETYRDRWCCILRLLSRSPRPRRFIELDFVRRFESPAAFESTFQFLVRDGRIIKTGSEHRAPYSITERGRRMLEGLC